MYHLNLESLARLVDEAPTADEASHLRDCLLCRREMEALRDQTFALAELPPMDPAPEAWSTLEARLLEEGLMRTPAPAVRSPVGTGRAWLRVAAAAALFLAGGAAGAIAWGRWNAPQPGTLATLPPAEVTQPVQLPISPVEVGSPMVTQAVNDGADAGFAVHSTRAPRAAEPGRPARTPATPAVRAAERELADAEAAYLAALQRYAELADPSSGADPVTRLEALDRLVGMSARALDRAPGDPQLNGYHLAAVNERDALRRQIQRAAETTWF